MDELETIITDNKFNLYFLNEYDIIDENKFREELKRITNKDNFTGKVSILNSNYYATFCDGVFHSFNDNPALYMGDVFIINRAPTKMWMRNGDLHREYGPAIINDSTVCFYLEGVEMPFCQFIQSVVSLSDEEKLELVLKYG